ncbi:unnamed protein product [Amaranthus hypochondriacus]
MARARARVTHLISSFHATVFSHLEAYYMESIETTRVKRIRFQQRMLAENNKKLHRIPPVRGRIKKRIFNELFNILKRGTMTVSITFTFCWFNKLYLNYY